MDPKALDRQWMHIQIFEGEVYVFFDDGHWKNTPGSGGQVDWIGATPVTLESLDNDSWVGNLDGHGNFLLRILLNPKVLYGKFGMPYAEE